MYCGFPLFSFLSHRKLGGGGYKLSAASAFMSFVLMCFIRIIPQALCSKFGLSIGANLAWLVWGVMGLLFIIAWPLSKILDAILGTHENTFFRRGGKDYRFIMWDLLEFAVLQANWLPFQLVCKLVCKTGRNSKADPPALFLPAMSLCTNVFAELKELLHLHGSAKDTHGGILTVDETTIMQGAIDMKDKVAQVHNTLLE